MLVYFAYYASIMLNAFNCLLCFKLSQHNRPGPSNAYSYTSVFRSVSIRTTPIFRKTRDSCFKKKVKPLYV